MNKDILEKFLTTVKQKGKLTILGHDNIDFDAFVSGILLSKFCTFLGISNEFILLERPRKNDTSRLIRKILGMEVRKFYVGQVEDKNRKLILVDHYHTNHLGTVLACIDHHQTQQNITYPFYYSSISCSTAYIIYNMMKQRNYPFKTEEIEWVMASMVTDTSYFKNGKTVVTQVEELKQVGYRYHLDFTQMQSYGLGSTPIYRMPLKAVIENGAKEYHFFGKKVCSSYIQLGMDEIYLFDFYLNCCLKKIAKQSKKENIFLWIFIIYDLKKDKTYQYWISKDKITQLEHNTILSRGTDIMPKIEEKMKTGNVF